MKLPNGQRCHWITPARGDLRQGGKNEIAFAKGGVRDGEAAVGPEAPRPYDNIQVERSGTPALTGALAEIGLYFLQAFEQSRGRQSGFHKSRGVGKGTLGWSEGRGRDDFGSGAQVRSEEHTSELQSLMRISYAVFCLKKKKK